MQVSLGIQRYINKKYSAMPTPYPQTTSIKWCLPRTTREAVTVKDQAIMSRALVGQVMYSIRKKHASIPALDACPEGKEKLSIETVANISISLCAGLERRKAVFRMPITIKSRIKPEIKSMYKINHTICDIQFVHISF